MYTQCQHCKAIFEVSMREVTVASGKLRCGECNAVFDAMATLSTTMPTPYSDLVAQDSTSHVPTANDDGALATKTPSGTKQSHPYQTKPDRIRVEVPGVSADATIRNQENGSKEKKSSPSLWLNFLIVSLITLLLAQIVYNHRDLFTGEPQRQPELIEMLNNNVFAHPNESGVLMIAASIENRSSSAQPYPLLEVGLKGANSELVALRRFKPEEYLTQFKAGMLMPVGQPVNLNLKIVDPGDIATQFQFRFL